MGVSYCMGLKGKQRLSKILIQKFTFNNCKINTVEGF